jgi:N-acetylneuraminic acid mutarotase
MGHIFLLLRSDPDQLAALDQLNAAQQDQHSPLYHHWLEPETFGVHFGVSEHDLAAVIAWLRGKGFSVEPAPPGRRSLVFSGTVGQVEAAFHTEIHSYLIDGEMHVANATDPEIPEALADVVAGPTPLHDFPPRSLSQPSPIPFAVGYGDTIGPADFATIYDVNPLYDDGLDGTGESIAILAQSNVDIEDIDAFMDLFTGCIKCRPRNHPPVNLQVLLAGADPGIVCTTGLGSGCDWGEATLDVERAMSVATGAQIKLVVGPNEQGNCGGGRCTSISIGDISAPASQLMVAGLYAVEAKVAPIISVSYGECESDLLNNAGYSYSNGPLNNQLNWWNSLWQEAGSSGIAVFVASGDGGAAGCDPDAAASGSGRAVNGYCSPPAVTCVGGTEFDDVGSPVSYWSNGAATSYIPESVWNSTADALEGNPAAANCSYAPPPPCSEAKGPCNPTGLWSSGGGESAYWSKPGYQIQSALTPADGRRDVPDISLAADGAHDPYLYYISGNVAGVGGTSAAAPSMAGIWALLLQNIGGQKYGNADGLFYSLASAYGANPYTNPFHPTQCGNNSVPGVPGYSAGTKAKYNQATGLGSVDAANMAKAFGYGTYQPKLTVSVDQTSIDMAVGATAQFTVHVAATGGFDSKVTLCSLSVPPGLSLVSQSPAFLPAPGGGDITFTFTTAAAASAGYKALIALAVCGGGWEDGAALTVNVVQCGFVVTPATVAVPFGIGSVFMALQAPVGCNWTASANPSWVTLLSPASGSGGAQLVFSYTANPAAVSRLGGVTVQGHASGYTEIVGTTIDQAAAPTVTLQTNSPGLQITVGGATHKTPYLWTCDSGSISVGVPSPQSGSTGVQYVYGSWNDGASQSRTISCPAANTTYTATFGTQYYLTTTAGSNGTVSPPGGWYNSGQSVAISASPHPGYFLDDWTGTGTGSYSGTSQSATVTINSPIGELASFHAQLPQTIEFGPLPNEALAPERFALSATSNSGLPVTFVSNSTPVCTVERVAIHSPVGEQKFEWYFSMVAGGTCSITASQSGNSTYLAAPSVTRTFTIQAEWAWMGGSTTVGSNGGQPGVYGKMGEPAAGNTPGGRHSPSSWTDSDGNLWLFGGEGHDAIGTTGELNDLWEFNPSTYEWTWAGGSSTVPRTANNNGGQAGVYGSLKTPAAGNFPGGRSGSSTWTDSAGHLWLFGGYGVDASGANGSLNDLWEFNPQTRQWAWMAGSSTVGANGGQSGVYLGTPASLVPGGRSYGSNWVDGQGNFWLFGGTGFDGAGDWGYLNDLWEFNPATGDWTYIAGGAIVPYNGGNAGVYGRLRIPAANNNPGGRCQAYSWTDSSGNLWLFGGDGFDENGHFGYGDDLWEFNPAVKQWAWMNGDSVFTTGNFGVYGTKGSPAAGNFPGGRDSGAGWADNSGHFWLSGGFGEGDGLESTGYLDDLWEFNPTSNTWTWMGGSSTTPAPGSGWPGVYGILQTPAPGNNPGGRIWSGSWKGKAGNLWLFGGYGFDANGKCCYLNDLWRYQL